IPSPTPPSLPCWRHQRSWRATCRRGAPHGLMRWWRCARTDRSGRDRLLHHAHVLMRAAQLAHQSPDRLAHRGGDEVELSWHGHFRRNRRLWRLDSCADFSVNRGRPTMPRYTIIAVVVALAGTMTATAQEKPDFSGEWQLNRQTSMLSPIVAPVAQTGTLRIEHKEPNFRCHMTIVLDGKPFETKYEMLSDGREAVATEQGRRTASSLRWDGDALVATWRV